METSPNFINGGESLGLPPEIARRKNGLMQALMSIPEDDQSGMGMGASQPSASPMGDAAPPPQAQPQSQPRQDRFMDDQPTRSQQPQTLKDKMDAGDYSDVQVGQPQQQNDHLSQLQGEYDKLGQPRKPLKLWQKITLGALTPFGGLQGYEDQRNIQDSRRERERGGLLQQIEAERRMQEQEGLADKRMTLQQQMESQREAAARDAQQPEHMDTDQGPIQWDRNAKSWTPVQVGGQRVGPKAAPKPDTPEQQFFDSPEEAGKSLKDKITDYAAATQKPEKPGVEAGTWSLQEDDEGNSVEFNSKTGATRPAPAAGLHRPGTYQKTKGAANDAQAFADMYLKSGKWSGPSDEALLEKYFELAKPSSGFRMTQNQMDMLLGARSAIEGMKARGEHLVGGSYFSPEQRQQIVETMRMITDSKGGGAKLKDRVSGNVLVEGKDF